jgi:hypothetical protein
MALALAGSLLLGLSTTAHAGSFFYSAGDTDATLITHPTGYGTAVTSVNVTICVDPGSPNAADIVIPLQNIANTLSGLAAASPNLVFGASNNIPVSDFDFESVALHELGHCVGMGHTNLGSATPNPNRAFASSFAATGGFNFDDGVDNIDGSADDQRDDDINRVWFFTFTNNPFTLQPTIDSTTYSRVLGSLPEGDSYAVSASREVGAALGFADTEAVMKQLTFNDEAQRSLGHDDVATLRYGMSGFDELQGTADDYTFAVTSLGQTTSCDIVFTLGVSGFASCSAGVTRSGAWPAGHWAITSGTATFDSGMNWFFNPVFNTGLPVPSVPDGLPMAGLALALLLAPVLATMRRT